MDTMLGAFLPGGALIGYDDDEGPGLNSGLAFITPVSGLYTFAVTGFPDSGFVGSHGETGPYRVVVSIPAPGSLCLLGIGALLTVRRRR
jgi:hypothetical protein